MAWFTANWFWVLIFIAFIAMHMFGHGGHGAHGGGDRQRRTDANPSNDAEGSGANPRSSGHQH